MVSTEIAPKSEIIADYNNVKEKILPFLKLNEYHPFSLGVSMLTIYGHSVRGHGKFEQAYPDTNIKHILEANFQKRPSVIKALRKDISKEFRGVKVFLGELLKIAAGEISKEESKLYSKDLKQLIYSNYLTNMPLFGSTLFNPNENVIHNPKAVLQGAVLGLMDSQEWRLKTQEFLKKQFKLESKIQTGTCHVGNLDAILNDNLNQDYFATKEFSDVEIDMFFQKGYIRKENIPFVGRRYNSEEYSLFIKNTSGNGCCDDASIITSAMQFKHLGVDYANDVFMGNVIVDHIDTGDKVQAFPITGGYDEFIANYLLDEYKQRTGEDLVTEEQIITTIIGGMKESPITQLLPESHIITGNQNLKFSDSVRRFNQYQQYDKKRRLSRTPLDSHLNYIGYNGKTKGMIFGFEEFSSDRFYKIMNNRIDALVHIGLIKPFT
jgi:hypothetical protein